MRALFSKLYPWLWFLFALSLPLETRYIFHVNIREYDTMAIYLTDVVLLLLLTVSCFLEKGNWRWLLFWGAALSWFVFSGLSVHTYWWLRLAEGIMVFYLMSQNNRLRSLVFSGFLVGMCADSLIGIVQMVTQHVGANKWLGMAAQLPWQPGVAVLESGAGRLLRSYGTLPHPNIFGGFVALALVWWWIHGDEAMPWLRSGILKLVIPTVLLLGVWCSFSRSAWLALAVGGVIVVWQKKLPWRTLLGFMAAGLLLNAIWFPFTAGRLLINNRLEVQSISERAASYATAFKIIAAHPVWGVGPGAFTEYAAQIESGRDGRFVEPVHNLYVLLLAEFGIIGILILIMVRMVFRPRVAPWVYPLLAAIAVIGCFDHYFWTTNSGRLLCLLIVGLSVAGVDQNRAL